MTKTPPNSKRDLARKPRGFPDRRHSELKAEADMVARVTEVYDRWGFEALDTGAFEYADALGKFLPDSDRPNAGVFALTDDDEQWMALRYDLTAPLARFAAEHWQSLPKPFRRYASGPVWRNEKPGPGRFRQFTQCDADTVGAPGDHADGEMIAMAAEALRAAGAVPGEFAIRVNTRELLDGVLADAGITDDLARLSVLRALDKRDRLGSDGVYELLGAGRMDESGDFTKGAELDEAARAKVMAFADAGAETRAATLKNLEAAAGSTAQGRAGLDALTGIAIALESLGVAATDVTFDPSIVRGLEYYTGAVFEAELLSETQDASGKPVRVGSVGGGGRYDDLVARFTGERVPATGFSVGISRLVTAFSLTHGNSTPSGPIVVLNLDRSNPSLALALVAELRGSGLRAEAYMGGSGMRAQMKYADRRGAPAVVIAGEDEIAKGVVTIKDLKVGAAESQDIATNEAYRAARPGQFEAPRAEMVARLKAICEDEDDN